MHRTRQPEATAPRRAHTLMLPGPPMRSGPVILPWANDEQQQQQYARLPFIQRDNNRDDRALHAQILRDVLFF